ncbi:hypothetical protein GCM10010320_40630 [Streptomyces caelestis]|uniref:N-methylhydantoinase A/oxoprolinase/acetone carboxylase beta subunit n=1 Tax=Streptomyces caelestis TaxID=36816 RepID=A0A7W9H0B6_9ACTN|nr:N-methylhydantoinase A/oxoprolinase/acetone carboxylase beta subunit [Streptomyces caelestis]GGW55771.1 hypothetical protein GCM10010320_40630 [Streptomyces caelestis]
MTGRQFRVDRDDSFTDIVARRPDGWLLTHEPLTDSPARSADAAVQGVRTLPAGSGDPVDTVRMGTRGATNALLERKAVLVIETPGGGGYGPPSPDPHQAGEEIDDLRAF